MSLWFQTTPGTFSPPDSRSIGWSQVPNRKATFIPTNPQDDNPQSSTGGGTLLDLGSNFNIKGPQVQMGFDLTMNYSNFQFQNVNDLTFNQQQFENNVNNTLNNIVNNISVITQTNYEARIAALEAWKATGDTACSGTTDIPVLEDWYYDPDVDANNILKMRFRLRIKDGLITSFDGSADSSTACAGTTANGLEPVNTCPEGLPTPGGVEFDEVMRIESIGT
jgi:hypothetical protein